MLEYIGNCSEKINLDELVRQCNESVPDYIGPRHRKTDNIPGLDEVTTLWENAGYELINQGGTVGWGMYFPGKQFDKEFVDKFCKFYDIKEYFTAWISRVDVGQFSPLHWDVNDKEIELAKLPKKVRYHCHISKPNFGQIFIVEKECFYNQPQGSTYKWEDRKLWHAGTNCGLQTKYILNLW